VDVVYLEWGVFNPQTHVFSSLDQICPMPVDLEKFFLDLFLGAIWSCRLSQTVISSDPKEEATSVDNFLKLNQLIVPSEFAGCQEKLEGYKCFPSMIRRCHLWQDTMR
jgi:hypothetical protein